MACSAYMPLTQQWSDKPVLSQAPCKHQSPKGIQAQSRLGLLQVDLETVCPSGDLNSQEYRLTVASQPLRVRIDQNVVMYLLDFFASGTQPAPDNGPQQSAEVAGAGSALAAALTGAYGSTVVWFLSCRCMTCNILQRPASLPHSYSAV